MLRGMMIPQYGLIVVICKIEGDMLYAHYSSGNKYSGPVAMFNISEITSGNSASVPNIWKKVERNIGNGVSDFDISNGRLVVPYFNSSDWNIEFFEKQGVQLISVANLTKGGPPLYVGPWADATWGPETILINGDAVYTIDLLEWKFYTINASNWDNPTFYSNFTMTGPLPLDPKMQDYYYRYFQKSGNLGILFDGLDKIKLFNFTDMWNVTEITPSFNISSQVFDAELMDDRLYVAAGQDGLFTYNISDPTNITLLNHYNKNNSVTLDISSVSVYNDTSIFIGDLSGVVSLINIPDLGSVKEISEISDYSCISLIQDKLNDLLFVGTDGYGEFIYNISNVQNLAYITRTMETDEGIADNKEFQEFTADWTMWGGRDPTRTNVPFLDFIIHFNSLDAENNTRNFRANIKPVYFLLYNDTNFDNKLTINVTRDENIPSLVRETTFVDEIFAIPNEKCGNFSYTDPLLLNISGIPTMYSSFTIHNYTLSALQQSSWNTVDQITMPKPINWVNNVSKNITFDLAFGMWLSYSEGNYSLKIDYNFTNWDTSSFSSLPSRLKLFSGMSSAMQISMTEGAYPPIYSKVTNDSASQEFEWGGSLVLVSEMAEEYEKINATGKQILQADRTAIPAYFEPGTQKIMGDSQHIYKWVLGASFDIDNSTTSIIYDPETTFITKILHNVNNLENPVIVINNPQNSDIIGATAPNFNISIIEALLDKMWYSLNGGANITFTGLTGTINQALWDLLPEGNVTIRFYANNTSGMMGYQEVTVVKNISQSNPLGIPGYNILLLLGMVSTITVIIIKKRLNHFH